MSTSALAGIRILDLTRVLAGPSCTQLLADLGAEVIKLERPGVGDETRRWGPPFLRDERGEQQDAAYFLGANRNKRSVAIRLDLAEGQALVRRLAAGCDVVVENFRPGALARYGLAYEQLAPELPRLVYCSITGFGQSGPYAHLAGFDFMVQALGGLMSITGEPSGPPLKVGVAVADLFAGLYAATGILAALRHRDRSGEGQHIDLALLDAQVAMLANQAMNYLVSGDAPRRLGNAHPNIVPYEAMATADGPIVVAVGTDAQFRALCRVLGLEACAHDPRFVSNAARVENRAELVARLTAVLRERPSAEWLALLRAADVPCAPVNDVAQVFADPHVQARGARVELPREGDAAPVPGVANPLKLSRTPVRYERAPPRLGEDTRAVLRELAGVDDARLDELLRAGVIA